MRTALVIADDPAIVGILALVLRSLGYAVLEAANASEAIRQFEPGATPVELVVKDVKSLDGRLAAFTKRLRRTHPDVRILCLCGRPEHDAARLNPFGGIPLQRPIRLKILVEALQETGTSCAAG